MKAQSSRSTKAPSTLSAMAAVSAARTYRLRMQRGAAGRRPQPVEYTAWLPRPGPAPPWARVVRCAPHPTRMRQVLQSIKTGEVLVQDVPVPATVERGVLVRAIASVVSAGTERMVVEFAEKNLLQKARARPDLVRQVLREGPARRPPRHVRRGARASSTSRSRSATRWSARCSTSAARRAASAAAISSPARAPASPTTPSSPPSRRTSSPSCRRLRRSAPVEHAAFATLGAIALHGFRAGADRGRRSRRGDRARPDRPARGADRHRRRLPRLRRRPQRGAPALARELGIAEAVLRPDAEARGSAFTGGAGFDAVLIAADATSRDPIELAGALARDRAEVVARRRGRPHAAAQGVLRQGARLPRLAILRAGPLRSRVRAAGPRLPDRLRALDRAAQPRRRSSI